MMKTTSLSSVPSIEIPLSGTWSFALDPDDHGVAEEWFSDSFPDRITLPGSLQVQGFGNDVSRETFWVGNIFRVNLSESATYAPYFTAEDLKIPFILQPEKTYCGPAWVQREVVLPEAWQGKRILLRLERAHWKTSVWVNGREAGSRDSLSVPHEYDLSETLTPGINSLVLKIDNRIHLNLGTNSHSISDHTQTNWNGVIGEIKLLATDPVWIEDLQGFPMVSEARIRLRATLGNCSQKPVSGHLKLALSRGDQLLQMLEMPIAFDGETLSLEADIPLGEDPELWDEFHPVLHTVHAVMETGSGESHALNIPCGIRSLGTRGTRFTVNGRETFLRGTLECCVFPLTGYPPTDVDAWKRIVRICKAHGLNHIRFHSWCPPEAAFVAADELGCYLQVECPTWPNADAEIGSGDPIDEWLYEEAERITRAYANHPSFMLMALGNEPGGKNHVSYLIKWCEFWKQQEPRVLHTTTAGWPLVDESDYHNSPQPRIQGWGEGLNSLINSRAPQTRFDHANFVAAHPDKPTLSHEIGQWCVYPDFSEITKYTGLLKAKNFEIFEDFLKKAGMADQARDFLMASGKLQALCYKADIEASLRTPGFGGFQLLGLSDFPGQGTALVGVLNAFWESKGYVTAEEHRQYCGPIVPLARLDKMVWTNDETLRADIEIAQFGPEDLNSARVNWKLIAPDGTVHAEGIFPAQDLPAGGNTQVGNLTIPLQKITRPGKGVLEIEIDGTDARNHWDLWLYPASIDLPEPTGIRQATSLDLETLDVLQNGGDVFLQLPPESVDTDVALGFSSIFWNTAWTKGQPPHTLGILCDPAHPALADFPTEFHSNWQWWDLIRHGATLELDKLPAEVKPLVQIVPDWFAPQRLALVFEARLGKGRLLVSSLDLRTHLENRPAARQMRASLLAYMADDDFQPQAEIQIEHVHRLLKNPEKI